MTRLVITSFAVLLSLPLLTCKQDELGPQTSSSNLLVVEDISATDVWLHISLSLSQANNLIKLIRGDKVIMQIHDASQVDTVVTESGLSPQQTYVYELVIRSQAIIPTQTSEAISVTTLPVTSHNLAWQTFLLGGGDPSSLYDVSVIDDSTIIAVGEVSVKDSSGVIVPVPFNVVRSNTKTYSLESVSFVFDYGSGYSDAVATYGFTPNDIVMSSGGSVMHWDGHLWRNLGILYRGNIVGGNVFKIWGNASSGNFWGVGLQGSLVHWDGNNWQSLPSGTTTNFSDIWGTTKLIDQHEAIFATVSNISGPGDVKILKVSGNHIDTISWDSHQDVVTSIWTHRGMPLYVGGGLGLYENKTGMWERVSVPVELTSIYDIRGTELNNIFVMGAFGVLAHFNGIDWQTLVQDPNSSFYAISTRGKTVAAAGWNNGKAILMIGKRN